MTAMSTSSWGRELKRPVTEHNKIVDCRPLREVVSWNIFTIPFKGLLIGRPLREVVSWNEDAYKAAAKDISRPLREVVSWNDEAKKSAQVSNVSTSSWGRELKQLHWLPKALCHKSTSSWGRELKHPPLKNLWNLCKVDLFERSWVET